MNKRLNKFLLDNDKWGEIKKPGDLHESIMKNINIAGNIRKTIFRGIILKAVAGSLAAVLIAISLTLWITAKQADVYFVYPYNGENKLELIGSFNNYNERIPMTLDKDNKVWRAKVTVEKRKTYEYQFVINEVIYTAGVADNVIIDNSGEKKGILYIM